MEVSTTIHMTTASQQPIWIVVSCPCLLAITASVSPLLHLSLEIMHQHSLHCNLRIMSTLCNILRNPVRFELETGSRQRQSSPKSSWQEQSIKGNSEGTLENTQVLVRSRILICTASRLVLLLLQMSGWCIAQSCRVYYT